VGIGRFRPMPAPLMTLKRIFLVLVALVLLFPVVGWFEWPYLLQVVNVQTGGVVLELPFHPGEYFTLEYRHSVQLTPIRETFRVQSGQLVLVETEYGALGVGLPYGREGQLENQNGHFRLTGLNRQFQRLALWVSPVAAQRLEVRGQKFELLDLVGPDTLVELRVGHRLFQPE